MMAKIDMKWIMTDFYRIHLQSYESRLFPKWQKLKNPAEANTMRTFHIRVSLKFIMLQGLD